MTLVANPFTGQVIDNSWSDAARTASALARKLKAVMSGRSYEGSLDLIKKTARSVGVKKIMRAGSFDQGELYGFAGRLGPKTRSTKITVSDGPLAREIAMHEVGHVKSGHLNSKGLRTSETLPEEVAEAQAWDWALKNARAHNISKRKLRRMKRIGDLSYAKGE